MMHPAGTDSRSFMVSTRTHVEEQHRRSQLERQCSALPVSHDSHSDSLLTDQLPVHPQHPLVPKRGAVVLHSANESTPVLEAARLPDHPIWKY